MTVKKNNGHQHLEALLTAFNQGTNAVLNLYNEDAIVKYPYAASLGKPSSFTMDEYRKHLDRMLGKCVRSDLLSDNPGGNLRQARI